MADRPAPLPAPVVLPPPPTPTGHDQPHQHTRPLSLRSALLIAAKRRHAENPGASSECRLPTGTTVGQPPEPRPQPVAREPEPRCQASTGIAQARVGSKPQRQTQPALSQQARHGGKAQFTTGGAGGTRTHDRQIMSPLLRALSPRPTRIPSRRASACCVRSPRQASACRNKSLRRVRQAKARVIGSSAASQFSLRVMSEELLQASASYRGLRYSV